MPAPHVPSGVVQMTRIRLAVLAVLLLSAVAAAAQTAPACAPVPADPATPASVGAMACGPVLQTPLETAGGSTCLQARQALHSELDTDANCLCGYCSAQYIEQVCRVIMGGYSVTGYLRYSCQICPE